MPKSPYHCRSGRLQGQGRSVCLCAFVCLQHTASYIFHFYFRFIHILFFLPSYFYLWPSRRLRSDHELVTRAIMFHRSVVRMCWLTRLCTWRGTSATEADWDFTTRTLRDVLICGDKITTKWRTSTESLKTSGKQSRNLPKHKWPFSVVTDDWMRTFRHNCT